MTPNYTLATVITSHPPVHLLVIITARTTFRKKNLGLVVAFPFCFPHFTFFSYIPWIKPLRPLLWSLRVKFSFFQRGVEKWHQSHCVRYHISCFALRVISRLHIKPIFCLVLGANGEKAKLSPTRPLFAFLGNQASELTYFELHPLISIYRPRRPTR